MELTAVTAATVLQSWGWGVLPVSKLLVSKELKCKPEQGQKKSLGDAALVPSRQMMKLLPFLAKKSSIKELKVEAPNN